MPISAGDIVKLMQELAPDELALDYDNVGLILGDTKKEVKRILVALDLNDDVAGEAVEIKADFVITHHPLIFGSLKKITADTAIGRRIIKLVKNDIAVYAAHTNLDIAISGTNDTLFELLGLSSGGEQGLIEVGAAIQSIWLGRVGILENSMSLRDFCSLIRGRLGLNVISYAGNPDMIVKKVGLCTGSASDKEYLSAAAKKGCDVYITGDVTYHNAQAALELGLAVIDGTHFATETIIVPKLAEYLRKGLGEMEQIIEIVESKVCHDILRIM